MERKRFNGNSFPIAAKLLNSEFTPYAIAVEAQNFDYNREKIDKYYTRLAPLIGTVDIVTTPFVEAVAAAEKSIRDWDNLINIPDFHVYNSIIHDKHYYIFEAYKKHGVISCVALWFEGVACVGYNSISFNTNTRQEFSTCAAPTGIDKITYAGMCLITTLFKEFADIESNTLPLNKKTELFRCLYLNELPGGVTLLTCRWFTELHQNNPFFVRGHWRFQPYGTKHQCRKLMWISTYIKDSYHSRAGRDIRDSQQQ